MDQDIRFCTSADGVRLAYAVSGEGPPLVMSATWLTHLEHQWRSLAWRPWLDAFVQHHKVLRHDSRGCGLVQSYVTDDKIYCVYVAPEEQAVRTHAQKGGFPADVVARVRSVIEPTTAE